MVYRTHLHTANREVCDRIDEAMRHIGQTWILPKVVTYELDALVSASEAAAVAGVGVETVRQWRKRGYVARDGSRRHLIVRGLSEKGSPMFNVGEVLEVIATTRSRKSSGA